MRARAPVEITVLCRRCGRQVGIAEVDGERVRGYRVQEGPTVHGVTVYGVGPAFRLAGSMADITTARAGAEAWDGMPVVRRTIAFQPHTRRGHGRRGGGCRATPQLSEEELNLLVLAAVADGESAIRI